MIAQQQLDLLKFASQQGVNYARCNYRNKARKYLPGQ
jgi:hypothetical protein